MANEFSVMKGFDLTIKGGESPETLPNESGSDVMNGEKLSDKASGSGPAKGKRVTNADDLTFDKELGLVEEKAKQDIADSYVSDIQGDKVSTGKGYQRYNELVSKGMAVEVDLNPNTNIREAMAGIRGQADVTLKELSEDLIMKVGSGGVAYGGGGSGTREWNKKKSEVQQAVDAKAAEKAKSHNRSGGSVVESTPAQPVFNKQKPGYGTVETIMPEAPAPAASAGKLDKIKSSLASRKNALGSFAKTRAGKITGAALGAAGVAGAGYGTYRALKNKEEKCGSMPMKKKGLEVENEE